jgi:TPR repeat protein
MRVLIVLCCAAVASADSIIPDAPAGPLRRQAAEMLRLGVKCDRNDGLACAKLANHHTSLNDVALACDLYEKSCRLGSPEGCIGAASCAEDYKHAIPILEPVCAAGHRPACAQLASILGAYREGDWTNVHQDRHRARAMWKQLCDGDVTNLGCLSGCNDLAAEECNKVPPQIPNRIEAVRLYQRACDAGCINSCDTAADMLHDNEGVPRDDARAATLWAKACEAGFTPSCAYLGELYRDGKGVPRDAARARQLFRRACARSHGQVRQCGGDPTAKRLLSSVN